MFGRLALGVLLLAVVAPCVGAQSDATRTQVRYLSGTGKDDGVEWDFFCTGGRKSGAWTKIPVPSHWEQHGFGGYNFGRPHDEQTNPLAREQGKYRLRFDVPAEWRGRVVRLVFDGVMTDAEVWVNGQSAGPAHQGSFYRFKYDVTPLLRFGEANLLEVTVSKVSANESVNRAERFRADYWVFGGIFRPVYLESLPAAFIDWTAIDARADGSFTEPHGVGGTEAQTPSDVAAGRRALPHRERPGGARTVDLVVGPEARAGLRAARGAGRGRKRTDARARRRVGRARGDARTAIR